MTDVSPHLLDARSITTERLELRPLTRDELDAACHQETRPQFHADFPTPDAFDVLQEVRASGEFFFTESVYSPLACMERESGLIIGIAGWSAPPIDDALEIEGFLVPSRTGRGYATEVLPHLVALGLQNPSVRAIRASVPEDQAALGPFLQRHGFARVDAGGTEAEFWLHRDQQR
ncbi:GNAT family N-acetyltransferase [Kocuria palustris]|uniref:GNAT family N-acetyltransferase n=1 Tax=Kocuria palustris TaxID=71999 RepID=UPI0016427262|nr:GNAT family protein [Kocuria palustris]